MPITHYIDDEDNDALNLIVYEAEPDLMGLITSREQQTWPGKAGVVVSPVRTTDQRTFRFVYDTRVTTPAARLALVDLLADKFCTGLKEIREAHSPDRAMRGLARVFQANVPLGPRQVNIAPRVVVEFACPIASKWDVQAQSRWLTTTPVDIPCGTVSHGGQLWLPGPLSAEVRIKYRNAAGQLVGELVLMPSIGSSDTLMVDLSANQLWKVDSVNVYTDAYAMKTGGQWFVLSHRYGNRALDVWGTLEVTGATGTYFYRRNWSN